MQAFQKDLHKFEKLSTQVLGVSPDNLQTHEEFRSKNDLSFPLIADDQGELMKLYAAGRVTYLIDRDGIIRFIQKGVPDNKAILEELEKLQQ